MLKELANLLCSLFVPRRAVSGGGGSLTVYGKRPSEFGISNFVSGNILVHTSTSTGLFAYVAPADGAAWIYGTQATFIGIRTQSQGDWPSLMRNPSPGSNVGAFLYVKKGQELEYHFGMGSGTVFCYFCPI